MEDIHIYIYLKKKGHALLVLALVWNEHEDVDREHVEKLYIIRAMILKAIFLRRRVKGRREMREGFFSE